MDRRTRFAGKASRVDWSWHGGTPQEASRKQNYFFIFSRKLFKLFLRLGKYHAAIRYFNSIKLAVRSAGTA